MKIILFIFVVLVSFLNAAKSEISVSIAPQKYFLEKIVKDKFDINVMVKAGSSPHTYEPKSSQMKALANSKIYFYRKLSKFTTKHFNGINFSFDTEKEILLTTLLDSGNFATTHSVIAKLEKYSHFSLREVEIVLEACVQNSQVSWILLFMKTNKMFA